MEFFFAIPVVVKVAAALALILVLNAWGKHLALSLTAGALLLAVWSGQGFHDILRISCARALSLDHALLLLITLEVIWLGTQMSRTGVMQDLVDNLRARISQRSAVAILPAVIGLLPMPGGAIFSAPLVENCDREGVLDPLLKTRINYWFRHVWEYWWPLYPGVLLLLSITGLDVWQLMLINFPLSLMAVSAGYFVLLRGIDAAAPDVPSAETRAGIRSLWLLLSPIIAVIVVYALVRCTLNLGHGPGRYVPMVIGVGAGIVLLQCQRPLGAKIWFEIWRAKRNWNLVLLVTLVRIYGAFVEARLPDGDLLVTHMNEEFAAWGIPVWAVAALIPFVCGIATGLAVGFVGASFPIVVSLLGPHPSFATLAPIVVLAYGWGYAGMMLSPVHVCLIVTNEHFQTRLYRSLGGLLKASAIVLCCNVAYTAMLVWLLP